MTEEQVKEAISNNYIAILANRRGFQLTKTPNDYGVDYTVSYTVPRISNGKTRYLEAPYKCDLQLKSTTEKSIEYVNGEIIYDLNVNNYNDLICRKNEDSTPLVFILFILPQRESQWVKILQDKLVISKNAYWYYPSENETEQVLNTRTKRIKIPITNRVDFDFFETQISKWTKQWK